MFGGSGGGGGSASDMFGNMFGGGGGSGRGGSSGGGQRRPSPDLFPKNAPGSGVIPLGKAKFPDASSKYLWIIAFYLNSSDKCQAMKGDFVKFEAAAKGTFKIGAMNCDRSPADLEFCKKHGMDTRHLPRFGIVVSGKLSLYEANSETNTKQSSPSMKAIHQFALEKVPFDLVYMCNDPRWVKERLQDPARIQKKLGSVLLLTDKYETSPKFASLAYQFRKHFIFGESRAKTLSMVKYYNVKKYPTLIVFIPQTGNTNELTEFRLENIRSQDIGKWIDNIIVSNTPKKTRTRR
mmetsp:Transcript_6091/g.7076  ORF Transcript_6091/g.7076 Transcript_6091/m.7076 type:complete len:293 (+) Transcript_6091:3-881(+)